MGTAREVASKYPSQILDIAYRKRQLGFRRTQISQWLENETELLKEEVIRKTQASEVLGDDYVSERLAAIEGEAKRQETEALGTFGMLAGDDPTISPLRRALAVWGLTIDDVGVASVRCPLAAPVADGCSSSTARRQSRTTRTSPTRTTSSSVISAARLATRSPSSPRSISPDTRRVRHSLASRRLADET